MNAIMKLTVVALGALSIVGGAAYAEKVDTNTNPETANYGTPPGAALKRDGSLRSNAKTVVPAQRAPMTETTTTNTVTDTSVINNAASANAAPVETAPVAAEPVLAPRHDRN